jgi:DNA-binding PadR family transcriptional regulator
MASKGFFRVWSFICYTEIEIIRQAETIKQILNYSNYFLMRRSELGEFEEMVLLTVAVLIPNAYSVAIAEELEKETGHTVSTGAVHAALQRMENKGLVTSHMGEATQERGGRRKRLFKVTPAGSHILQQVRAVRESLWSRILPHALPKIDLA